MILHVLAILMILGLAYLQTTQGLFSSLIMAVCSVFSAAIAFSLFGWLAATSQMYELQSNIADAVSMSLLFIGSLIGLRMLADRFLKGDIYFDLIVDRVGGGVFGLVSGTVMVGMLLVVIQLAPFGRVVWGDFRPFGDSLERDKQFAPFFPDDFVVGFGETISAGSMSGGSLLTDHHDDLLLEAFCARNTAGRGGRTDIAPGAIRSVQVYNADSWANAMAKTGVDIPDAVSAGSHLSRKVVVVRVSVNVSAADNVEPQWWRLPATQFRLRCASREGKKTTYASFYPVGYVYYDLEARGGKVALAPEDDAGRPEVAKLILCRPAEAGVYGDEKYGSGKISEDEINLYVDWVYVLPQNASPQELFFRRVDAQAVPASESAFQPAALREKMLTTKPPEEPRRRR